MDLFGFDANFILKRYALWWIRLYQKTLSLDHGPFKFLVPFGQCRFRPTCSEYAYEAVEKFGVVKGLILGSKRLLKCHPFNEGGWDPVPPSENSKIQKTGNK
jgi:hypothetical protein